MDWGNQKHPAFSWGDYILLPNASVPYFILRSLEVTLGSALSTNTRKLLVTLGFVQIGALQLSRQLASTLLISEMTEYDVWAGFGNPAWFLVRKDTVSIQSPLVATLSMGIASGSWSLPVRSSICSTGAQLGFAHAHCFPPPPLRTSQGRQS